jgi:hypothetical protein
MKISHRLRDQPRWRVITAVIVVAALAAGVTVVALLPRAGSETPVASSAPSETAKPTPTATPTPTPTPEPVKLPTADVAAAFDGWSQDNEADEASTFTAEAGDASDGSIALRIESTNPAENPTRRALSQTVAVTPSTTYTFTASIKNTVDTDDAPGVAVIMGAAGQGRFDFPDASTNWTDVTWDYKTAADETTLPVSILSVNTTTETRVDGLTMSVKGAADNLLVNPSFETFTAPNPQITNSLLMLPTGEATVGVSWRIPGATWSLTDDTGATVADGTVDLQPGLGVISLQDVEAGYYSIDIANAENSGDRLQTSLAIVAPVADGATPDERFGVGVHLHNDNLNSGTVAAEIGFSSVRSDAKWEEAELTRGQYTFPAKSDAMIQDYADAGLEFFPISDYNNKLYDRGVTPSTPEGLAAYAAYTRAMVTHFDVPSVEIYNEFNQVRMNKGACGLQPSCYIPMLKAAYEGVKADHPDTLVIGPSIARHDEAWLEGLYQAGGLQYLDAISFHPYDYTPESGPEFLEGSLQRANDKIKQYNNGELKPIWITELGWSTAGFSEADQADNVVRSQVISLANNVEKFYWFNLVNGEPDPANHEGNFGLVRQTTGTVPAYAPKPSAASQAVLIRKVSGKEFTARDASANTAVHSYAFGAAAATTRVAWAVTPTTVTYAASGDVTQTDQFGAISTLTPVDGRITVELDGHPLYLDGALSDMQ